MNRKYGGTPIWVKLSWATINISQVTDTIAIPNQALYREGEQDWVLVRAGNDLERREVTLGLRGPNRSEVVDGLDTGDEVALFPPGEGDA